MTKRQSIRLLEKGWNDFKPAPSAFVGPARQLMEENIDLQRECEHAKAQISFRKQIYTDDPLGIDVEFMMNHNRKTRLRRIAKTLKIRDYVNRDSRCRGKQFTDLVSPIQEGGVLAYLGERSWAEGVYDRLLQLIEEKKLHRVVDFSPIANDATAPFEFSE